MDANYVCTKGYGDCKGLTNYLKTLLNEVGIPSYAALVSAGTQHYKVDPQFPANYFNHVILCVPNDKDTIWVECTNTNYIAGYLGSFTENRLALLCTETGGHLVKTPEYGKGKTFLYRTAKLNYNNTSKRQDLLLKNSYSGLFQDELYHSLKTQSKEELDKVNSSKFLFPSYQLKQYETQISGIDQFPQVDEKISVTVGGLINKIGERAFINLGWLENPMKNIIQIGERTQPIVLQHAFTVRDSILLNFPEDLEIERLPTEIKMDLPFAILNMSFYQKNNYLLFVREYEQKSGIFDSSTYPDYQKAYAILNAQTERLDVVLKKKSN